MYAFRRANQPDLGLLRESGSYDLLGDLEDEDLHCHSADPAVEVGDFMFELPGIEDPEIDTDGIYRLHKEMNAQHAPSKHRSPLRELEQQDSPAAGQEASWKRWNVDAPARDRRWAKNNVSLCQFLLPHPMSVQQKNPISLHI